MLRCICSDEWLLSYNVRQMYLNHETLPHSFECELEFTSNINDTRDLQLLDRWKWATATEKCDHPYSHKPHGNCSGRSFDRT